MGERLELRTLGGLNIQRRGSPVTGFDSRKVPALLVYLACTGRTFPREVLAEMLWEERTQAQALSNLRVALHSLNQTLGDYVEITRETVGLRTNVEWWLDAREFEALLSAAGSDAARLDAALDLYGGDFLAGFFVDSGAYEQWATRERERLRLRAMEGLDRLISAREAGGEYAAGIAAAARLLDLDPLREETYRQQMRLLALSGQRGKALEVYETCRRLLDTEFGLTPLPQTLALYEQLRAGDLTPGLSPAARAAEPLAPVYTLVENPYKGLCAFDEADEADFFGRETLVERVLARLAEPHPLSRFLAVVGPSGSGKSSVVHAGVIPALRRGGLPGSAAWPIVTLLPGAQPFDELEIALRRTLPNAPSTLIDDLRRDARGLLRAARLCLPDEQQDLVLVIDQFEEVFTLVGDAGEARAFLDNLYAAATTPRSPIRILITLRADFYDRPLMIPDFSELVRHRTEVITPMTPDELERAVAAPAQRVGVQVDPALLAAVVAEISQQPGALPMMEYALTEVFEHRVDHTLTLATYESIGGALGALARRANEIYDHLSTERQAAARQICLRLVTPGEGTEDTRRRTLQAELLSVGGGSARAVLHAFDRARLLTFDRDPRADQPTVELAHEAIIREWALLHTWLDESRDDVRLQRRLSALAAEWEQSGRDRGYLLTGSRLAQYEEWSPQTDLALSLDECQFLEASSAEHRRQRTLRRRVRNAILSVAVLVAVVMTVLALFAFGQRNDARNASKAAQSERDYARELALVNGAQAALVDGNVTTALALAVAANRDAHPSGQAQVVLSKAAYSPGTIRYLEGHVDGVYAVAYSPDGSQALSADMAGGVLLWDTTTYQVIHSLVGHTAWVAGVGFSRDGLMGYSVSADKTIILWNLETGESIRHFTNNEIVSGQCFRAFLSLDDRFFVSTNGGGGVSGIGTPKLLLWEIATGQIVRVMDWPTPDDGVCGLAVSPDGRMALAAGREMILWNLNTGEVIHHWENLGSDVLAWVFDIVFSPEGDKAVTTSWFGDLLLWDMKTYERLLRFDYPAHEETVALHVAAFSPDSRAILVSAAEVVEDRRAIVWDANTGELLTRLPEVGLGIAVAPDSRTALLGEVNRIAVMDLQYGAYMRRFESGGTDASIAVSPDGQTLLVGPLGEGAPCGMTVFDIPTGSELHRVDLGSDLPEPACQPAVIVVSPDSRTAITNGSGGEDEMILWDIATGKSLRTFSASFLEPTSVVNNASFSPDGQRILSVSNDGNVILWDVATGTALRRFQGHTVRARGVAFSPDGHTALTSSQASEVVLWDVATGSEIRRFEGHLSFVDSVAFSPDGQAAVSCDGAGQIIVWDVGNGRQVHMFQGQGCDHIAFSPDGRYVFSSVVEGGITLWDIATGDVIRQYPAYGAATYHPDGNSFFAVDHGDVYQWRFDSHDELLAWTLDHRYVRDLTCEERDLYRIAPLCEQEGTP